MIQKDQRVFRSKTLLTFFLLSACTFSSVELEIDRGEKAEEAKDYKDAAKHFHRAIKRADGTQLALYSAKKLANISLIYLDDIDLATYALNYIILNSKNVADKKVAIERQAKINYEKKQNYEQAVVEFQRLLSLEKNKKKITEIQYLIAKSYFYMNRLYQAEEELNYFFDTKNLGNSEYDNEYLFRAKMMKANIYHAQKKYEEAVKIYTEVMERFPKRALKEKVWLNLTVCYEDMKQFSSAVRLLEDMKEKINERAFIEQKISRLKQRMTQEPGAKGLKK